jgi:hypothetical protein
MTAPGLCGNPVGCHRLEWSCGWCLPCYKRWNRAGRPAAGPPAPMTSAERTARSTATNRAAMAGRIEDYADLRSWGNDIQTAAYRAGIARSTACAYERTITEETADAA